MTNIDPGIRFPGESEEYRRARNRLLEAEVGLRRAVADVAAERRRLPPGGLVPDDYRFEQASDGAEVRFSELFHPGKDMLVIYSFMFPRHSGDTRPGPAGGETAKLPLAETPCASCTSILDSLDGAASHLRRVLNLAVVAKSDPERIRNFASERGWRQLSRLAGAAADGCWMSVNGSASNPSPHHALGPPAATATNSLSTFESLLPPVPGQEPSSPGYSTRAEKVQAGQRVLTGPSEGHGYQPHRATCFRCLALIGDNRGGAL